MEQGPEGKPTVLEQRRAMLESGEFQRELMSHLLTPQAMEVVEGLLTAVFRTISTAMTFQFTEAILAAGDLSRAMEQLASSPLLEYLASGRGPDIGRLIEGAGFATVSVRSSRLAQRNCKRC